MNEYLKYTTQSMKRFTCQIETNNGVIVINADL